MPSTAWCTYLIDIRSSLGNKGNKWINIIRRINAAQTAQYIATWIKLLNTIEEGGGGESERRLNSEFDA